MSKKTKGTLTQEEKQLFAELMSKISKTKRWGNKTKQQRSEHGKMMVRKRWEKAKQNNNT